MCACAVYRKCVYFIFIDKYIRIQLRFTPSSGTCIMFVQVLYGLGGESSTVAQNVILAQW